MTKPIDFEALDRALTQPGGAEHPAPEAAELAAALRGAVVPNESWDEGAGWQRLRARLAQPSAARSALPALRGWPLRIAALLVVGLGVPVLMNRSREEAIAPSVAAVDHTTGAGLRRTVTLADGTRVMLAPSSRLRVPATYPATRDVDLIGEAFFDVVHDPARPFSVMTALAQTIVLGTQFNVRGYSARR